MKFILLTHERELNKSTNTGRLVKEALGDDVDIIIWKRKEPDKKLCHLLETRQAVLLFPNLELETESKLQTNPLAPHKFCVILDSTWQEARKMFNQSIYLRDAEKISLTATKPSEFKLRRNQLKGGLSTAECVIEVLKMIDSKSPVEKLTEAFNVFNNKRSAPVTKANYRGSNACDS